MASGNKYQLNDEDRPTPTVRIGETYTFNLSDDSIAGHAILFSTTPNGVWSGGLPYKGSEVQYIIDGKEVSYKRYVRFMNDEYDSSKNPQLKLTPNRSTPTKLYYYCSNHPGMGGELNVEGEVEFRSSTKYWDVEIGICTVVLPGCIGDFRDDEKPSIQFTAKPYPEPYIGDPQGCLGIMSIGLAKCPDGGMRQIYIIKNTITGKKTKVSGPCCNGRFYDPSQNQAPEERRADEDQPVLQYEEGVVISPEDPTTAPGPRLNVCPSCNYSCLMDCMKEIESSNKCDPNATDCGRCDTDVPPDGKPDPVSVPPGRQFDSDCDGSPDCTPGDPCDTSCDCGQFQISHNQWLQDICGAGGPCSNGNGGYDGPLGNNRCCEVCQPGYARSLCTPCNGDAACCAEKERKGRRMTECWQRRYTRNPRAKCKCTGTPIHEYPDGDLPCCTCEDLARMHNGGPCGHKNSRTKGHWDKIRRCMARKCPTTPGGLDDNQVRSLREFNDDGKNPIVAFELTGFFEPELEDTIGSDLRSTEDSGGNIPVTGTTTTNPFSVSDLPPSPFSAPPPSPSPPQSPPPSPPPFTSPPPFMPPPMSPPPSPPPPSPPPSGGGYGGGY